MIRRQMVAILIAASIAMGFSGAAQHARAADRTPPSQTVQHKRFALEQRALKLYLVDFADQWINHSADERIADCQTICPVMVADMRTLLGYKWSGIYARGIPGVKESAPFNYLLGSYANLAKAWVTINNTNGYGDDKTVSDWKLAYLAYQKSGATLKLPK
jgi:hypothetical protein